MSNVQLTPEKLKTFKGLENLSEEQAAYYCEQINEYAAILLKAFPFEEIKNEITTTDESGNS